MNVKILDTIHNFKDLSMEVSEIVKKIGFERNQIICQGLEENNNDWYKGIGRIEELEEKEEKKYKFINSNLKNTCIETLIKKYQGFRSRIMLMNPKSCYSIHRDPTPRIHVPIITDSSQSWMIWPLDNECHRMPIGMIYWADTTKKHTFINASDKPRIHLIMCVDYN